jgi:hypothetical protein
MSSSSIFGKHFNFSFGNLFLSCCSSVDRSFSISSSLAESLVVKHKPRKKPLCHFYKSGICRNGNNCKYRHVEKNVNVQDSERKQQDESLLETSGKEDSLEISS